MSKLEIVKGDITKQEVDAIVNAAHEGLCGGGGVDGAIHKAAGPMMTGECMNLPVNPYGERCPVGECRMTGGYDLPALYILHTVGPVWQGGKRDELRLLSTCYGSCLYMADRQGLQSIAFPCISTGAFAFPKEKAAKVALQSVALWIRNRTLAANSGMPRDHNPDLNISSISIVCFDEESYQEYLRLIPDGQSEI